jgi:hypothetical protein
MIVRSNAPVIASPKKRNVVKQDNITYQEIDVYFETYYELFSHFGSKLCTTTTRNTKDITLSTFTCTKLVNDAMIQKFSEHYDLTREIVPADHATVCILDEKGTLDVELESTTHDEGVHFIMISIKLPGVKTQLEKYKTKRNNRVLSNSFVQPIPRTNRFVTRIFAGDITKIEQPHELCKFTTILDCNSDSMQTVGMIYYDKQEEVWNYRSTNYFRPVSPKKLVVQVETLDKVIPSSFTTIVSQIEMFITVHYHKQRKQTKSRKYQADTPNVFLDELEFDLPEEITDEEIIIKLHDQQMLTTHSLGSATLPPLVRLFDEFDSSISNTPNPILQTSNWYSIKDKNDIPTGINLKVNCSLKWK